MLTILKRIVHYLFITKEESTSDEAYSYHNSRIDEFLLLVESLDDYLSTDDKEKIIDEFHDTFCFFKDNKFNRFSKKIKYFNHISTNFDGWVDEYNTSYIKSQRVRHDTFFKNIENKALDKQQQVAVLTDDYSNLIVAGAGSGKTLTILGKVKYLVQIKKVQPDKILLLSFTNKTVDELNQRLEALNIPPIATTFHKLGYDIIKSSTGKPPELTTEELLSNILNKYLGEATPLAGQALESLMQFTGSYLLIPAGKEYPATLKPKKSSTSVDGLRTLKSYFQSKPEKVRSHQALVLANYLFLCGINYEYGKSYPKGLTGCCADFYLPDYNIWIEHLALNANGEVDAVSKFEEWKYLKDISARRSYWRRSNLDVIETYAYEYNQGCLLSNLKSRLEELGVKMNPLAHSEVYSKIICNNKVLFNELYKISRDFINLSKSNGLQLSELHKLYSNNKSSGTEGLRQKLFINFILQIYTVYQQALSSRNKLDFNDMINLATNLVSEGYNFKEYEYIIVDEYQDISLTRFKLIESIRNLNQAKLTCVGDDWQSIYRFAGSDIFLFNDFDKYVGQYKKLLIEQTYRNSQELIDMSAKFIQKNPLQIKKSPYSKKSEHNPLSFVKYNNIEKKIHLLIKIIQHLNQKYGASSDILVIGRHSFDIEKMISQDSEKYIEKYDQKSGKLTIKGVKNKNISFSTVHRSKGLEADNVILINADNGLYGFPNKLVNDPILDPLLTRVERYPFAEERRLFYVALTRTKNEVYILSSSDPSLFIKEIRRSATEVSWGKDGQLRQVS